jgi:thioester reductase-like protein
MMFKWLWNLLKRLFGFGRKLDLPTVAKLMRKDGMLSNDIQAVGDITPPSKAENIFLIGATGIVGPYLLRHLLDNTKANIYCLMHHRHGEHAKNYLLTQLERDGLDKHLDHARIHIVHGNIAEKKLGLNVETYQFLAQKVDVIFHNAAWTNHIRPYAAEDEEQADIRNTNALSVHRTLALATKYKTKLVNFTSTIGAINRVDLGGCLVEELPEPDNQGDKLHVGYLQSKFVAEKLIFQAIERGVPCRVFRLGQITGDSKTGVQHADKDHMMLELKACVQMGLAPDWTDGRSFVPSDIAASIIGTIGLQNHAQNGAYNINNPHLVNWLEITAALNRFDHKVEVITEKEWLEAFAMVDEKNALYPLRSAYQTPRGLAKLMPSLPLMFAHHVHCERTMTALENTGIKFPPSSMLLEKYLAYFNEIGFFEA